MSTKSEKAAVISLLEAIEDLRVWLDDTGYPRRSRIRLDESVAAVCAAFPPQFRGEHHAELSERETDAD